MALYVATDYWVEGYAEGDDTTEQPADPRVITLIASLSDTQQLTATHATPAHSYDASLTSQTHEAG